MANLATQQVLGGHTARILLNGVDVGFCQGVTWNVDDGVQEVFVLGSVEAQEHQQTHYSVSGEINRYYIRSNIADSSALGARTAADLIRTGTFDLQVVDSTSGQTVVTLESCTLGSQGSGMQAGSLVSQRYSFRALKTR
jgi:hypothetical protein